MDSNITFLCNVCKHYSSEAKGIVAVGSQGISQNHTGQQTSHKIYWEKHKRKGGCLCLAEKQQRTEWEGGYKGFLGGGVFHSGNFQDGDW